MSEANGFFTSRESIDQFKATVLEHLNARVSDEEWSCFREHAQDGQRVVGPGCDFEELSRAELVASCFSESNLSIGDVLVAKFKESAEVIGEIESAPVYYVRESGFYVWGQPDQGFTLDLWITWPAYPFGW